MARRSGAAVLPGPLPALATGLMVGLIWLDRLWTSGGRSRPEIPPHPIAPAWRRSEQGTMRMTPNPRGQTIQTGKSGSAAPVDFLTKGLTRVSRLPGVKTLKPARLKGSLRISERRRRPRQASGCSGVRRGYPLLFSGWLVNHPRHSTVLPASTNLLILLLIRD